MNIKRALVTGSTAGNGFGKQWGPGAFVDFDEKLAPGITLGAVVDHAHFEDVPDETPANKPAPAKPAKD